jgi:predicted ATPase/DNA-binding XRE family transcriptional regulator
MKIGAPRSFGAHLKALRETAGFTQEELATISGLSVHAVSALERGERRRPHLETVRALSAALDLTSATRDALLESARPPARATAVDELIGAALPLPLTRLVGRDNELETLSEWLADPGSRLITLIGPGGVGKTRLGLELARAIASEGTARVAFVSLASIRDAQLVAPAIAEALGLANVTARDLPTRARLACADQPTLLMLDNFEQVLDAAPLVADLLGSVASLRFLATSRAPLRVRGEREFVVGPLALDVPPDAASPADLARAPGVRLFLERVRDVEPGFRLTTANASTVTAICRRLDALPLALELAAPWMKVLSVEDLLRRLTDDALLPSIGPRDLPERQRTINATVAWSYQLLAPADRQVFRRLGALPGRFAMDAAAAVIAGRQDPVATSGPPLGALAGLIDKSLLLRAESAAPARPLYEMLETVRAYAGLELAASGEREDALEGLARYCIREAALTDEGLVGPAQLEWLDRVRHDLDNYRSAMAWLIATGRPSGASNIAFALRYFWLIRGHVIEGIRWYEQILSMPSLLAQDEAKAAIGASTMWFAQGELGRARTALERVLAIIRGDLDGDADILAQAEYLLGHVCRAAGNPEIGRDRFASSLERFRALNVPSGAAKALTGMAAIALAAGSTAEAERLLEEVSSLLQDDAPWFLSFALWLRALLAVQRGDADQAIVWARESLIRIRALNDRFAFVYAVVPLAAAAALKGNDAWAARILGLRDAVAERTSAALVDALVHDLRARAEHDVRARLGPARWERAYAAGRAASIDSLLKDIDRALA